MNDQLGKALSDRYDNKVYSADIRPVAMKTFEQIKRELWEEIASSMMNRVNCFEIKTLMIGDLKDMKTL